jgi:hypothetical protein
MAGNKDTALRSQHSAARRNRRNPNRKTQPRKSSKTPRTKSRRRDWKIEDSYRVTTFPEAKGKVVREVRFSHRDVENILAIAFKDRTVLVFTVDPEPMVLPVEIQAQYFGKGRSGRTWDALATDKRRK